MNFSICFRTMSGGRIYFFDKLLLIVLDLSLFAEILDNTDDAKCPLRFCTHLLIFDLTTFMM